MASGWNLWVWLPCIGVVSGCCCKEVYRYPNNNFLFSLTPLVLALFWKHHPYTSLFIFKMFFWSLIIIITFPYFACISSFLAAALISLLLCSFLNDSIIIVDIGQLGSESHRGIWESSTFGQALLHMVSNFILFVGYFHVHYYIYL